VPERDRTSPPSTQPGHYGEAGTGVTFVEVTIASAWNVQGKLERGALASEAHRLFGVSLPAAPNTFARNDSLTALWLGPQSWLLVARGNRSLADFDSHRDLLNAAGGALFDVGASRVAWTISGPRAETVLAKSCPLDFHPRRFPSGTCAQSLLGHVNALFAKDADAFTVMVARSFARDVWHSLCESAAQYGYEVNLAAPYR
jgi:sarcosine oxidase, subunit gamma